MLFETIAKWWYDLTGNVQQDLMPMWDKLLEVPIIGAILNALEIALGRGSTI